MADVEKFVAELNLRYGAADKPQPMWENELSYDSSIETLEPVYYWILDFTQGAKYKIIKLADNFVAAPGSSYFADLSARATRMQEEGMKILGAVNMVIKSITNILYDLKEFEIRLSTYEQAIESDDQSTRESGILALKDIWMSSVDMKRGRGSINQMTYELGFTTLRDAFMKAKSIDDVGKMNKSGLLNDRVARVLKPRIAEFLDWKDKSYDELKRRFNIEKAYLKSQVDTLKLYSGWVKPYLVSAEQLRMGISEEPSLISAFGTMVLKLSLMMTKEIDVKDEAYNKNLPENFIKLRDIRPFHQLIFLDYTFRTYPTQQFPHAGRVDIKFRAYALNEDELLLLQEKIEKDKADSMLGISGSLSDESLKQLQDEIDYFTKRPKKEEKKKEESAFSGIFKDFVKNFVPETKTQLIKEYSELYEKVKEEELPEKDTKNIKDMQTGSIKTLINELKDEKKKKEKMDKIRKEGLAPDNYDESVVRNFAEIQAADFCYKIFDTFKKSRGMASFPSPFDEPDVYRRLRDRRAEIQAALKK